MESMNSDEAMSCAPGSPRRKRRICYIYDGDWPQGATRVIKETRALAAAGHEIVCVTRNSQAERPVLDEAWMQVRRLPQLGSGTVRKALNFPFFGNPVWISHLRRVIQEFEPDLLLVADLPLAPLVVWLGQRLGVEVHYDMAEVYPEFLRSLLMFERMGPIKRAIRHPALAERAEQYVLPRVAMTYVVSEESAQRLERLGVHRERICLVGNTPEQLPLLGDGGHGTPTELLEAHRLQRPILLFVGILIGDRGVIHAVDAMPAILEQIPDALLVIVGDGPERPGLLRRIADLSLEGAVQLVGWRQHAELAGYYAVASIGLIPFRDSPHVRITLANKLFDYMSAALPVLAADLPSTRRIVESAKCGRLFTPDSPAALADVAVAMLRDPATPSLGLQGRTAIETTFNWQLDAARLVSAVGGSIDTARAGDHDVSG